MYKIVSVFSLCLLMMAVPVSAAFYNDYLGMGGHWAGSVDQSSYFSQSGIVTVNSNAEGNHIWGDLHGNNSTGYGMWMTVLGGGGGEINPSPSIDPNSVDPNDPLGGYPPAWIAYTLDDVYDLTTMWIWNFNQSGATTRGFKDATVDISVDGINWTQVFRGRFAQASGMDKMPRTDFIVIGPVLAKYIVINGYTNWGDTGPYYGLSEVRWDITQPIATNPIPPDGSLIEGRHVDMSWLRGRNAVLHDVYFGTDAMAVTDATVLNPLGVYKGRQSETTYDPGTLEYGTTYYWRIDEVDFSDNIVAGEVWSFTVANYYTIEDYESYDASDPNSLTAVWKAVAGTGSTIALATQVALEHQSMQFEYDNSTTPYYSEVQIEFPSVQDWSEGGLFQSLALSFFGRGNNSPDEMSIIVEDSLSNSAFSVYTTDPVAIQKTQWTQWNIAYTELTGVDLTQVKKLTLRIGNGTLGGTGKLYLDDIRRHPTHCLKQPIGDINGDCVTNLEDFSSVAQTWMTDGLWP